MLESKNESGKEQSEERENPKAEPEGGKAGSAGWMNIEVCGERHHHHLKHRLQMPPEETVYRLADLYKVFGDPTRIRILFLLTEQELCVCDIADVLGLTQSAISHQLRLLKQMSLVKFRREGKTVYYSIADDHVSTILSQGLEHAEE